jgi:hypothetical protein
MPRHFLCPHVSYAQAYTVGYPAPPGVLPLSISPEYKKMQIFNEGIKIGVSMWSHLYVIHPLQIPIPMCKKKTWVEQENS